MEERMGIAVGLTAGLAIGLLVVALLFRKKVLDCTFDERFRYGFFTLMGSVFLYGASELALGRWCDAMAGGCLCIAVSITVFAVICILKDAYLSLRERPWKIIVLFLALSLFNLGLGTVQLLRRGLLEDGVLSFRAVNLICGVMTLVILAVYLVNFSLERREEAE